MHQISLFKNLKISHCEDVELRHCNQRIISLRGSVSNCVNKVANNCYCEEEEIRLGNPDINKLLKINKNHSADCTVSPDCFTSFAMTNSFNSFCGVWKKLAAFTLAEVLITLGIVGVVAAMTIPMLITKYEKIRNVNQLKKTYSELSQAFRAASEENDLYTVGDNWQDRTAIVKVLKSHIKVVQVYDTPQPNRPMCYDGNIRTPNKGYGQYSWLDIISVSTPFSNKTASMKLLNGACVGFDLYGSRVVFIDINGSQSPPNRFGKDLFMFELTSNNSFIPYQYNLPYSKISSDCKKGGKGMYCAARIIREGWEINYY